MVVGQSGVCSFSSVHCQWGVHEDDRCFDLQVQMFLEMATSRWTIYLRRQPLTNFGGFHFREAHWAQDHVVVVHVPLQVATFVEFSFHHERTTLRRLSPIRGFE